MYHLSLSCINHHSRHFSTSEIELQGATQKYEQNNRSANLDVHNIAPLVDLQVCRQWDHSSLPELPTEHVTSAAPVSFCVRHLVGCRQKTNLLRGL